MGDKAQGSQVQALYAKETTFGTAPTTMTVLRPNTGLSLSLSKESYTSDEIRSDRQIVDFRHGQESVSGDVTSNLFYSDLDNLLASLVGGTWTAATFTVTSPTISFNATGNAMVGSASSTWTGLSVGDVIDIAGGNNAGYAKVGAIAGTTVTLAHHATVTEAAGTSITVTAHDKLTNGTTKDTYSFEIGFTDIGKYLVFTGCLIDTGTITISPGGIATVSFGVVGKGMDTASSSQDSSPAAASTNDAFSGIDTSSVYEGGASISIVTDVTINFANSGENNFALGSASAVDNSQGRLNITGSATAYFEDLALVEKFVNETESSLQMLLLDPDSNPFWIDLPRIKYSAGVPQVASETAITVPLEFQALGDIGNTGKTVIFAR